MEILILIFLIIISSIVIYFTGNRFAESSTKIGDFLNIPRDVKGATFDAVSSSLPELLVALYSVIFFKQFDVGIGTIAGSALFNLLVIPGICVFVSPVIFKVSKKVVNRDAIFYLISVFILLVMIIYLKYWGIYVSLILLLTYIIYVKNIKKHTNDYRKESNITKKKSKINIKKESFYFFLLLIIIGIFTFILTDSAMNLSYALNVPSVIIAFTIIAAATSVPDTIISVSNAKKGHIDDATSNVFGSNVFDILVGIGLPLLIYYIFKGSVEILFTNVEIIIGLLGSTILLLYFFSESRELNKKQGTILLLLYLIFICYTIFLAL